jgi:NADPH-dependent 2,4-dienoyl-CoA reductase/sulfur reductase-like enzyme
MSDRYDVVVVGAGPAGIAAACRAAESGARVLVADDNLAAGGQIWRGEKSEPWLRRFALSGAVLEAGSAVFDDRLLQRGRTVILATGARELFLPFPGWTLPGVTGVGGLQALIKGGLDVTGKRVVVAGSGPLLSVAASLARERGASVMLVAEQAPAARVMRFARGLWRQPAKLAQGAGLALSLLGVARQSGCWVEQATGDGLLQRVRVRRGNNTWEEPCDLLAVGFGLTPNVELAQLPGCHLDDGFVSTGDWQQTSVEGVHAAGELTGIGGVDKATAEGEIAGLAAANRHAAARALFPRRAQCRAFAGALKTTFALRDEVKQLARPETLICRCEDVPLADLRGFAGWREAKLQTRCGMGACQGRVCGAITRALWGWGPGAPRPPLYPVPVGDLMKSRSS